MIRAILGRLRQQHRTIPFPPEKPELPPFFRGHPLIDPARCPQGCQDCADACPTDAILKDAETKLDLGRCLLCTDCQEACAHGAISHSTDYRVAARERAQLLVRRQPELIAALEERTRRIFGRSLALRQVSAGGCNACEADVNVLNTVVFDLVRFGVQIVASPRHADGLLITGPVSKNMEQALRLTYEATPPPRIVIAVGACAISGGPFAGHPEQLNGADSVLPVDLYIPGCPPHPLTILDGILRLLGRV